MSASSVAGIESAALAVRPGRSVESATGDPPPPARPGRHVLVARLDNLGDVVLAGPAVRAAANRAGQVTFLCGPGGEAAARLLPGVDRVIVWSAPWVPFEPGPLGPIAVLDLVDRLGDLSVDDAAVLTSFHQSPLPLALLLRMAEVRSIAAVSVDYPGSLLDHRLGYDPARHEVTQNLAVTAALGYQLPTGDDGALRLASLPEVPAGLEAGAGSNYTVVHPGASVPARGLPADRVEAMIDELVAAGRTVVATGSPAERCLWRLRSRPGLVDLVGRTSVGELAAVLAGADAVVCGNTGAAHLAAAVATPVVSVFAPVVPALRWRPWRVPHRLLGEQDIGCAGCRSRTCPHPGQPCLDPVTPGAVRMAVDAVLAEAESVVPAPGAPVGRETTR